MESGTPFRERFLLLYSTTVGKLTRARLPARRTPTLPLAALRLRRNIPPWLAPKAAPSLRRAAESATKNRRSGRAPEAGKRRLRSAAPTAPTVAQAARTRAER